MERNLKSDEPETGWMEEAKRLLGTLVALDYVQACRNPKPEPVSSRPESQFKNSHSSSRLVEFLQSILLPYSFH